MILEVCWDGLWTLSFGLSQFHGHGSWVSCEVAFSSMQDDWDVCNNSFEPALMRSVHGSEFTVWVCQEWRLDRRDRKCLIIWQRGCEDIHPWVSQSYYLLLTYSWDHSNSAGVSIRCVGVIWFTFHVLQLPRIRFTQHNLCCISLSTMKHVQKPNWKSDLP